MRARPARFLLVFAVLPVLFTNAAAAVPPAADVHDLRWFVHVDLIDAGAGQDLAFWQDVIDTAMGEATRLYEGGHGPVDTPCCTRVERSVSVATFGTAGDGLDMIDSAAEIATLSSTGLPGSRAFLVDSLSWCSGPAPTSIGCAVTPACDGDADDDPDLWLIATLDARDLDFLGSVLAHERGHNACLTHVEVDECQLMRSGGAGHCIDAGECADLSAGRTTTGGTCTCHDGSVALEPDGASCTDVAGGICSGGVCGDASGEAGVRLLSAAGPESGDGELPDDALRISALTGNWTDQGPLGASGEQIEGLAYAHDAGVLYGVIPTSADDSIVTVDPLTGDIVATVGTIANGSDGLVALAYDPGPSTAASDDRLLALETDYSFEDLVEIDPASPSSTLSIGPLAVGAPDGFRGLAFDSATGKLYTASPFVDGLYEVGMSCAPFCSVTALGSFDLPRQDASLAYSSETGRLYLVGTQLGSPPLGRRLLYDIVDPATGATTEPMNLDAFTPAALAALPLPPACSDGIDNDLDGMIDLADLGCYDGSRVREDPQCQDGINNDGDGLIDFDGGQSIHGACDGGSCPPGVSDPDMNGVADPDPHCSASYRNKERNRCGLGFELAPVLVLLSAARHRRCRARIVRRDDRALLSASPERAAS